MVALLVFHPLAVGLDAASLGIVHIPLVLILQLLLLLTLGLALSFEQASVVEQSPVVLTPPRLDLQIATRLPVALVAVVPFGLPLARTLLGLQKLLIFVAAHVGQGQSLRPAFDSVAPQPSDVGAGGPDSTVVPAIALHNLRGAYKGVQVAPVVVVGTVRREQVGGGDESPRIVWDACAVAVSGGCPTDESVSDSPLHPGRAPGGIGAPHPAVGPDPATVVVGSPAEGIG